MISTFPCGLLCKFYQNKTKNKSIETTQAVVFSSMIWRQNWPHLWDSACTSRSDTWLPDTQSKKIKEPIEANILFPYGKNGYALRSAFLQTKSDHGKHGNGTKNKSTCLAKGTSTTMSYWAQPSTVPPDPDELLTGHYCSITRGKKYHNPLKEKEKLCRMVCVLVLRYLPFL